MFTKGRRWPERMEQTFLLHMAETRPKDKPAFFLERMLPLSYYGPFSINSAEYWTASLKPRLSVNIPGSCSRQILFLVYSRRGCLKSRFGKTELNISGLANSEFASFPVDALYAVKPV